MTTPKGYTPKIKIPDKFSYRKLAEKRAFAKQMRDMWQNIHKLILESLQQQ